MNSRRLAQKWPVPRHKLFERHLQGAASAWFKARNLSTHPKMAYCLKNWHDWKNNLILDEVASYIEGIKQVCERDGKPFPLHKYIHHGLSSQAMAFNLIGPLITRNDYAPLSRLLAQKRVLDVRQIASASFEYEDRSVFNEDSGQPTSMDIVLRDQHNHPFIFIESKLTEREFGGCSVFSGGDCDGANPIHDLQRCYLHFIGRRYWELMEKYGFSDILREEKQCLFATHYQFFREVIFSLEKNGIFILLSDERSPVFQTDVQGNARGLMPFLLSCVPSDLKQKIASISVQELLAEIKTSGKHVDWVGEFEQKYGL